MKIFFASHRRHAALVLLFCMAGAFASVDRVVSADLSVTPPDALSEVTLREFIERRADLLMIRAMFDVVPHEDILPTLEADARRLGDGQPTVTEIASLHDELLTEGSYLLVSLSYTVQSGGAVWPSDKAEAVYERDARVMLEARRSEFLDAMEQGADPLPVLKQIDAINALTYGETTPTDELDHFSARDALVEEALARLKVET
jgi:hypothetical protein